MDGFVHITKVEKTRHEEPVAVYNFHVKEWISFFVGRIKIYVHDAMDAKKFLSGKGNTYHWDDTFGPDGHLTGHGAGNPDALIPHIQIHPKKGNVIRIFFKYRGELI